MKDKLLRPFRIVRDMWRFARDAHRVISISRNNVCLIEGEGYAQLKSMKDDYFYHLTLIFKKTDDRIIVKGLRFVQVNSPKHRKIGRKVII